MNKPLHRHPLLNNCDVYGHGKPTRLAHSDRDLRQPKGSLPVSESMEFHSFNVPWFKHDTPELIEQHALAFRKVAEQANDLLTDDPGNPPCMGEWIT